MKRPKVCSGKKINLIIICVCVRIHVHIHLSTHMSKKHACMCDMSAFSWVHDMFICVTWVYFHECMTCLYVWHELKLNYPWSWHLSPRNIMFARKPFNCRNTKHGLASGLKAISIGFIRYYINGYINVIVSPVCGAGIVLGEGSICDVHPRCDEMVCSIRVEMGYFSERAPFTYYHDQCNQKIFITVYEHQMNISYKGKHWYQSGHFSMVTLQYWFCFFSV